MSEELKDLYYCYECNRMVDDGHRCEQWSQTTKIPIKAIELILSSHKTKHLTVQHEYWKDMFNRLVSSIDKISESMRKEEGIAQEYGYDLMTVVADMENGEGC